MSTRDETDHVAEAVNLLSHMVPGVDGVANGVDALTHAVIALVREQRTANLIAYQAAGLHKGAIDGPGLPGPGEQARKALRL